MANVNNGFALESEPKIEARLLKTIQSISEEPSDPKGTLALYGLFQNLNDKKHIWVEISYEQLDPSAEVYDTVLSSVLITAGQTEKLYIDRLLDPGEPESRKRLIRNIQILSTQVFEPQTN